MIYQDLELISHHLCPYVQRSVITLLEKGVDHKRNYIDLSNKPAWFVGISPTGKVPLLRVDKEFIIFESAVICEFIDEVTPGSLHPEDPVKKAVHRAWNEFASSMLNNISTLYNADNLGAYEAAINSIEKMLVRLETEVKTPYFSGDKFCMVDAAYAPVFRYFDVIDRFLPYDIFANIPNVKKWRRHLAERNSAKQAVSEDYPILLEAFLVKRDRYISRLITSKKPTRIPLASAQSAAK
jgi:glutathione S-transferase